MERNGEKWQFKMEMYVLSISPLQWDGRNIKYRNGRKFGPEKIHGERNVDLCKCKNRICVNVKMGFVARGSRNISAPAV